MPVPSPEEMQYALGIHPEQMAAAQAAMAAAGQGDQPASDDVLPVQPRVRPRPLSTDTPDQPEEKPAETVPLIPRHSMISKGAPRALDVPPVGTPGPIPGTSVASSAPDSTGSIPLAKSEDVGPVGAVPGAKTDLSSTPDLMRTPIRPISGDQAAVQADQGRETKDRTELERLQTTGSGVDQFHKNHHILGGFLKGLSIAGSIISPGAAALIPGTDLHHQVLVNQARGQVGQDIADEKEHSTMADHNEANAAREQNIQGHLNAANAKFVAGSEKEDANSPTGYTAQTIGGEWKPYTPPASYKSNKGEDFDQLSTKRAAEADKLGLTGDKKTFYVANGKLREPNPNQPQVDEDRKARLQRQQQHDQDMQQQRYTQDHARWAEHKSAIEKEQEQGYAKIENDWRKKYGPDSNNDVTDKKDTDPAKVAALGELERQKKLLQDSVTQRFNELGAEPNQPQFKPAPTEEPAPQADTDIPQPIASVRTPGSPAPLGGPVQTPQTPAKAAPAAQQKPGSDLGPAPDKSPEGRTGKLPDGTKVVVKGGRLVAQ